MNKPQIFQHPMFGELPVIIVDGIEWFGATEAAKALSFSDPHKSITNHVEDDDSTAHPVIDSLGRTQQKKFINESGLYSLIFGAAKQSNNLEIKAKAKEFKKWVTSEVLPTIRKTGSYSIQPQYRLPQTFAEALEGYAAQLRISEALDNERKQLAEKIETDRPLVLYAESVQVSKDSILIGELAKLLKQNDIDIGEKRLFKQLREEGYLMSKGDQYNMPTQRSMELKIMEIKPGTRGGSNGAVHITRTTKITGKGQVYFINKFKDALKLVK